MTTGRLADRLNLMQPWYRESTAQWILALTATATAGVLSWLVSRKLSSLAPASLHEAVGTFTVFGTLAGAIAGLVLGARVARLFPWLVFRIGDGINRDDNRADWRKRLFWSVIVAAVVLPAVRWIIAALGE
jgi:hypothetical protein